VGANFYHPSYSILNRVENTLEISKSNCTEGTDYLTEISVEYTTLDTARLQIKNFNIVKQEFIAKGFSNAAGIDGSTFIKVNLRD